MTRAGPPPPEDPQAGSSARPDDPGAAPDPLAAAPEGADGVEAFRQRCRTAARQAATGDGPDADAAPPAGGIAADHLYEPADLCDAVIVCGDGTRLGVHRAFLLRNSRLLASLFEEFPGQREVSVSEAAGELRPFFLDVIYDRGVPITPDAALRVLQLADKYEAEGVVQACRAVIISDEFRLNFRPRRPMPPGVTEDTITDASAAGLLEDDPYAYLTNATVAEALCIASKHGWDDLFLKCCADTNDIGIDGSFAEHTLPHLGSLKPAELMKVMRWVTSALGAAKGDTLAAGRAADERAAAAEAKAAAAAKMEARIRGNYSKLLKRYNKLVAAAQKAGVDVAAVTRLPAPSGGGGGGGGGPPPLIAIPPDFDDFLDNFI